MRRHDDLILGVGIVQTGRVFIGEIGARHHIERIGADHVVTLLFERRPDAAIESGLNLRRHVRIVECLSVGRLVRLPVIRREHMAARETIAGLV